MSAAVVKPGRRAFARDDKGVSAVEFALIDPLFALMTVGVIDFGNMLSTKLDLDASVSTAAAYAQMKASDVGATNGASLATTLSLIVANARGSAWADSSVVVNNGPRSEVASGGRSSNGTASQADFCYCPQLSGTSVVWGSTRSCNAACPSGGALAGKFIAITATRQFTPAFFTSFAGPMRATALVQTN